MIRIFDLLFSILGIILFFPLFVIISILIMFSSKGPVFYLQNRIGLNGSTFNIIKFRTMKLNSDKSGLITVGEMDSRITLTGYYLRKLKLDELPQLINVLLGDMSIVGPRPEVKKFVDFYSDYQRKILKIKPGITDWATIKYHNENKILEKFENAEKIYIEKILPDKIKLNLVYVNNYNLLEYLKILFITILKLFKILGNLKATKLNRRFNEVDLSSGENN